MNSIQGSCISGIIGTKIPKFCLFGELVVTAAEMETKGTPEAIHASQDLVDLVPEEPWKKITKKNDTEEDSLRQQTYLLLSLP